MLTKKQNFIETIKGGHPDRFVNQFEPFGILFGDPFLTPFIKQGEEIVNGWGITIRFQENTPGPFPVHDDEHKVLKDITKWREVVKAPKLEFYEDEWAQYKAVEETIDRNEVFATAIMYPGVFEQLHYLMGMQDCLMNFYEEPEEMRALIEYITEWELGFAKILCEKYHPDALFHHDDWGSAQSSFLSPSMFAEFIVPAYKKIYGYYKDHGVDVIIHHSDSYAANLVPSMIDMGIDVWQGATSSNNVPELIKKYGEKISFMGNIDNSKIDSADWTEESVEAEVRKACKECGKLYFIPNATMGGPESVYPGVYDSVSNAIDKMSKECFG